MVIANRSAVCGGARRDPGDEGMVAVLENFMVGLRNMARDIEDWLHARARRETEGDAKQ